MKMQRTVKLELECLCSRELPGNLLSLLSSDLASLIRASAFQDQRVLKQLPKPSSLLAETKNVRHNDASLSAKTQSLRKHVSAEFAAFLQNTGSQSRSPLQADTRLNSFLPTSSTSTPSPRSGYSSVEDSSVSPLIQQPNRMATVESGLNSQNFGTAVSQVQLQLDELTKAVSRKNPIVTGPTVVARSEVQQFTYLDVPINANNDNGSAIVEYIPNIYDFDASNSDYEPNVIDPELLPLPLLDETPYPNSKVATQGAYEYYLSVSQPSSGTGGRIRLWDSQNKENEYTTFNIWTTQHLEPIPFNPGFYSWPQIYLEGVEPSWQDHEIEITLKVKWDANGLVWTSNYRAVKATITPRIEIFKVEQPPISGTFFTNQPNGQLGTDTKYGYYGYGQFYAVTMGAIGRGTPKYLQLITAPLANQLVNNTMAVTLNNAAPMRMKLFGNRTLPLLDTDNANNPFYDDSYGWRLGNKPQNGVDINNARKYTLASSDSPQLTINQKPTLQGVDITEIKYQMNFKLYLVMSYTDQLGLTVMFPYAYTEWKVNYWADTFVVNRGATVNRGNVEADENYIRSHAKPDVVLPPFANNTILIGD